MSLFKNASPQMIHLGADDQSMSNVTPSREPIPQHCPMFYIFAKKGPVSRELLGASKLNVTYGSETFDINDKYFNHQTRFLTAVAGQANSCMVQRLVPKDAGVNSNAVVYMDVMETDVPNYVRDSYGSYVDDPDANSKKVDPENPTIKGYKIKFIKETMTEDFDKGNLKPKTGTQSIQTSHVPEIKNAYDLIIRNIVNRIKVGEVVPIYDTITTQEGKMFYNITSSNRTCIALDGDTLKWVAKAPGTTKVTISLSKLPALVDEEPLLASKVEFDLTVTANDVKETPRLVVGGIRQILTPEENNMKLVLDGDNVETAKVTVSDTSIATYDEDTKTITATTNGVFYVTVNIPATVSHEGITEVFTVQSKVIPLDPIITTHRSTMYPIFELKAKYPGEYYNNIGFAISSLFNDDVDSKIVSSTKSLPYKLALFTRSGVGSSPVVLRSLFSEPSVQFSFKEKAINPNTEANFDFETVYENNWYNETDDLKTLRYFEYDFFYFYRNYFEELTKKFLESEKVYVSDEEVEWGNGEYASSISWFDFTTDDKKDIMEEFHLINPFICKSSKNVNYFTVVKSDLKSTLAPNQKEITISGDTPIFLDGGSDGTMSNENFEQLLIEKMNEYVDQDSQVQDLAVNVESIFYDSGFTLATKKELVNFITMRKDTSIVLSTHDDSLGDKDLPLSEARAVGIALKARYQLAPESEYFGTPVARGIVVVGTGKLRDGSTNNRIPLSYEIAIKSARMMGSSTGYWDQQEMFDNYPGNSLEFLIDPSPAFIPAGIKPTLWNEGLVWVQPYDRSSYHIPALQTIYDRDTSVLNNFFVMMTLGQLVKCSDNVWRKYTGTSGMSNAQFMEVVSNYANDIVANKFGDVVSVVAECQITEEDEQRGYSWRLIYKVYGNHMKTVMVAHSEVYSSSALEE